MITTPPVAWRPLLDGACRERALAAIDDIAVAMEHGPSSTTDEELSPFRRWSLGSGTAGIALFYAYLAQAGLRAGARVRADELLDQATDGMAGHSMDPSLIGGFAGIGWAHLHIRGRLFADRDVASVEDIDDALLTMLRQWHWPAKFDLLYGLAGLGVYALEELDRPNAGLIAQLIVDRLEELAERPDKGLAWFTPPDGIAHEEDGEFCLGMAHGTPGVVAFLARAIAADVAAQKARPMLETAVTWMLAQRLPAASGGGFPPWRTRTGEHPGSARLAWCYGDPGVAGALFAAGQVSRQPDWERDAVRLLLAAHARTPAENRVVDATLCHGAAGVAHACNRLYHATGEQHLADAARYWFTRALEDFRQPGSGIAGFTPRTYRHADPTAARADEPAPSPDPGFLTGAAGIGRALLAAVTPVEPPWDGVLLMDSVRTVG